MLLYDNVYFNFFSQCFLTLLYVYFISLFFMICFVLSVFLKFGFFNKNNNKKIVTHQNLTSVSSADWFPRVYMHSAQSAGGV